MMPLSTFLLVLAVLIALAAPPLAYAAWLSALALELIVAGLRDNQNAEPALVSVRTRPPNPDDV